MNELILLALTALLSALLGALIVYLYTQKDIVKQERYIEELEESTRNRRLQIVALEERLRHCDALKTEHERLRSKNETDNTEMHRLQSDLKVERVNLHNAQNSIARLTEQVNSLSLKLEKSQKELGECANALSVAKTEQSKEQEHFAKQLQLLEESKERMKLEFSQLAEKILQRNSERFKKESGERLETLIKPIKEQFGEFKKQINEVYDKESRERNILQNEIKHIKELNLRMSEEATRLTKALKGESKTQGIWGEMILQNVLDNSGLREGDEYMREVVLTHKRSKKTYRPDVIVKLPDEREIIIDAKTSLSAYERYVSETDETRKEEYKKEHLISVKRHIKELSEKDYTNLEGINSLDFIFMFIPIESALLTALESDRSLFEDAYKKNVILVAPTTLMVALRAVENSWKYDKQQKNALEIADRAGKLYDKFIGFIESMERLGSQLQTAQKSYEKSFAQLHTGVGSVTSQFEKLKELGAKATKSLPQSVKKALEE